MTKIWDYKFKVFIAGYVGCGKTSVLNRFSYNKFNEHEQSTSSPDASQVSFETDNRYIRFELWSASGSEASRNSNKKLFTDADGIVLVYDITWEASFNFLQKLMEDIKSTAPKDVKLILVGNKCDMDNRRAVTAQKAQQFAAKYNMKFVEVSAKSNANIDNLFKILAKCIEDSYGGTVKIHDNHFV